MSRSKSSTGESPLPGDNVSIHSAYSTTTEDATLHEAYMGSVRINRGRGEGCGY